MTADMFFIFIVMLDVILSTLEGFSYLSHKKPFTTSVTTIIYTIIVWILITILAHKNDNNEEAGLQRYFIISLRPQSW